MRLKAGTVGLAMLALLVGAPAALASTASRSGTTVVYAGDASADAVTLSRYVDTSNSPTRYYYIVNDSGGITSGAGCFQLSSTTSACEVSSALQSYRITAGGGDDRVDIAGATSGGSTDLGPGNDTFTGLGSGSAADTVDGGDGGDTIDGGAGNDPISGGAGNDLLNGGAGNDGLDGGGGDDAVGGGPGNDLVAGGDGADALAGDDGDDALAGGAGNDRLIGKAGNDRLDGGAGDDSLEFAVPGALSDAGVGADDLHGGTGVDLLSYNEHTSAIRLTLDELPGDGSTGENDNVHNDIETVIATTLADTLTGDDLGQYLYGNGGSDTIDGRGGADLLNGGTGDDVIRGGAGADDLQGSAGGDFLDGGPGQDLFEGDNECTALPCTGGADQIMARDNEQDTVNCGVGADRATVDLLDIVATDSQQGCESVDRAALPIATPPDGPLPGAAGATMSIRGSHGLRALLLKGALVEVKCPGACRIRGRLILRETVVASARRTRIVAATTRLRLKANKAGRRQLKRRTKVRLTLVVDVTDSAGTETTLSKAITFKARKKKTAAKQPS